MKNGVAFFGMGNMGLPMAKNLAGGFSLRVFDPSESARSRAAEAGLTALAPRDFDADGGWDAIFTMLPDARAVEDLLLGQNGDGILHRVAGTDGGGRGGRGKGEGEGGRRSLFADFSTTGAESARRVAGVAGLCGVEFLDAPVSGGVAGAAMGKLSFMAGGAAEVLERARPYLERMGGAILHAGPAGSGQAAKMCNNMLLSTLMIGTCEALALGAANGLDAGVLSEIMRRSSGGNWVLEVYNPWPGVKPDSAASRGYDGGFLVDLMLKDSDLAMEMARASGVATPLGSLANQIYRMHQRDGWGRKDFSSALEFIRGGGGRGGSGRGAAV